MTAGVIEMDAIRRLLTAIGGDPEDLEELLEDFQAELPDLIARMQTAAAADDLDALRIAAHTLKSNARDFGAMRLSRLCEAVEHACRQGQLPEPAEKVSEIASEAVLVEGALHAFSQTGLADPGASE